LRARGLRPVQRPDPRPCLPRAGHALAAAPAAGRPAGPQACLRSAVAAQRQQHAGGAGRRQADAGQDPFRIPGAAARGPPPGPGAGRAAGAGVDLRRPGAGPRQRRAILLTGRSTLVRVAAPVDLRGIIAEDLPPERTVRKLSRVLRTHFNRIREAMIGPDLSTRRLLIDKVLAAETVKDAIADQ